MKTKNLILIVALLSIATMTFSQSSTERVSNPFSVKITLKCALQDPFLVRIMHEQLNPNFLNASQEAHYYSAVVKYRGTRVVIYGTLEEWRKFFNLRIGNPQREG